jgi:hypothetical protein
MKSIPLLFLALAVTGLAGCETNGPTGPAIPAAPAASSEAFNEGEFAWSIQSGGNSIVGALAYHGGPAQFTCQDVVLIPRTPWSRRRMIILYGSDNQATVPAEEARARTPSAPAGDYARFVRHATCDKADRFSFTGLPDGAWFVITVATPKAGGDKVAIMQRVETQGGVRHITLG